jgi:hypothetical protein
MFLDKSLPQKSSIRKCPSKALAPHNRYRRQGRNPLPGTGQVFPPTVQHRQPQSDLAPSVGDLGRRRTRIALDPFPRLFPKRRSKYNVYQYFMQKLISHQASSIDNKLSQRQMDHDLPGKLADLSFRNPFLTVKGPHGFPFSRSIGPHHIIGRPGKQIHLPPLGVFGLPPDQKSVWSWPVFRLIPEPIMGLAEVFPVVFPNPQGLDLLHQTAGLVGGKGKVPTFFIQHPRPTLRPAQVPPPDTLPHRPILYLNRSIQEAGDLQRIGQGKKQRQSGVFGS